MQTEHVPPPFAQCLQALQFLQAWQVPCLSGVQDAARVPSPQASTAAASAAIKTRRRMRTSGLCLEGSRTMIAPVRPLQDRGGRPAANRGVLWWRGEVLGRSGRGSIAGMATKKLPALSRDDYADLLIGRQVRLRMGQAARMIRKGERSRVTVASVERHGRDIIFYIAGPELRRTR